MRHSLSLVGATALVTALFGPTIAADNPPRPAEIAGKMAGVADDLGRRQTGEPVQTEQKTILRDLDELIASLEKQCENCRNGIKRNNPNAGMRDSMISGGTGGVGTLVDPNETGKDWGKLSGRERDRILQSMSEGFPPEYRTVLERYYRRLADEKAAKPSGKEKDKDAAPAPESGAKP